MIVLIIEVFKKSIKLILRCFKREHLIIYFSNRLKESKLMCFHNRFFHKNVLIKKIHNQFREKKVIAFKILVIIIDYQN